MNDPERSDGLRSLSLLEPQADEALNRLARLGAMLVEAPVGLVSLATDNCTLLPGFLGRFGLPKPIRKTRELPLQSLLCRQVVETGEPLVISDTSGDPSLAHHPAIIEQGVAAYAGIPLVSRKGHVLGSLCTLSFEPRYWRKRHVRLLEDIAAAAGTELELRAEMRRRSEEEEACRQSHDRLKEAFTERTQELAESYVALQSEAARREEAAEALAASEQQLARVLSISELAVFALDSEGVFTNAEGSGLAGLNGKAGQAVGRSVFDLCVANETVTDATRRALRGEEMTTVVEIDDRIFEASYSPKISSEGIVEGVFGVALDVTHKREIEDQLRQAQKMEAVGRLAGGVAHDFNNHLAAIKGYTELLLAGAALESQTRSDLVEINAVVDRAAAITGQLLAFSRKQVLERRPIDLNRLVLGVERLLRRLMGEDLTLVLDLGDDVGNVVCDPSQLEQVIVNLAVNARDAMPNGGSLGIETRALPAGEGQGDGWVSLSVFDDGEGIPESIRRKIFDPFFTTKPEGKGTGLGLSTVFGIVTQSGGSIELDTTVERGARFNVLLPHSNSASKEETPKLTGTWRRPRRNCTVLVVEDEGAVREVVERFLRSVGYNVLCAANPDEAREIFADRGGTVDVVLSDVILPGESGPALVESLTSSKPDLKVVYMTGYTDDRIRIESLLQAGARLIRKPFSHQQLLTAIDEAERLGRPLGPRRIRPKSATA